ncbi:AB hydrolase superfamily protein YdjP [Arthrobacter saudimassiliensis]|uniref:AB hydrolase superfamily protein YdjP n=1 Tax=Arthrobacter saudimassiliensis TaxID=1461584 RepID=A0A078MU14_9MICC|nr:AB hydrolase superfamily protein YdjP [Arthrobacter saudimassiliensis]
MAAEPAVRRLRVEGHDVGLRTAGAGPGVVLVHGIGASGRYFERLAAELAADHRVHTAELPGHARLRAPGHALTMSGYAAVLVEALRRADVGPVQLVGHSMGCQVVVEAAIQAPELVSSLVLLGPTVNDAERSGPLQALRLGQDTLRESPAVNRIVFSDYLRAGPRWYLTTLPRMIRHRLEERLPLVDCPVALVRGERDPVVPRDWIERLAQARPGTLAGEVPGEPHVMMWRRPAETARWCRRLEAEAEADSEAGR